MAIPPDPSTFDIAGTYHQLLTSDPDLTMPVAAIESLIHALSAQNPTTVSETLDLVQKLTTQLKSSVRNPISLSAGTDLFQQYLVANLQRPTSITRGRDIDFEDVRRHLVQNGRLFVRRAKEARETIARFGTRFVRDSDVVLTTGGSRVVGALLRQAAEAGVRFRVIYVVSTQNDNGEGHPHISTLRKLGIPVATIPPTAMAYSMNAVTQTFVGAEGVVENGGIVSRLGTYQLAILAKNAGKPVYVVAESHKFVRLFPLGQWDLGIKQDILQFSTGGEGAGKEGGKEEDEGVADLEGKDGEEVWVDYTPPHLISGIITESGVLLPSAVSEELIKIWF
ncbi:hypothetical protein BAUCODRAFT_299052 [Baudoinia panamericana UAMH 10762]|uniref:Translation initiation factor eIF2B subunit alpha n=1 Tax=Baudoinia panamericana (strain UAMH 10762) TaxID=717646 RepID=M2MZ64_BAUPA|nr:uncharacterized protein BAUCODRAFT_299052 [Baudoinia panamericana UAMH 10762]EMC91610.1 hypothetical protein BAUCODRAFT_299052 [Baudoinia panamericana UAMH 10762]